MPAFSNYNDYGREFTTNKKAKSNKTFVVALTRTEDITAANTLELMQAYHSLHVFCRFRLETIEENMGGVICNSHSRELALSQVR